MIALNFNNRTWLAIGDSHTYGYNADPISNAWVNLINAERSGQYCINNGHPGEYLQVVSGENCLDITGSPRPDQNGNSIYCFFNEGCNDIKGDNRFNVTDFKAQLLSNIDYLHSVKLWPYSQIVLSTVNYFTAYGNTGGSRVKHLQYNEAIRQVAYLRNTVFLDLFAHFDALPNKNALLDVDGVHLINEGHREQANFFEAADYTPIGDQPVPSILLPHGKFII